MSFEKLTAYLDSLRTRYAIPGCGMAVYHNHEIVFRHNAGFSDYAGTKPASAQDVYFCYSTTKPMTMTAATRLIQEGRLHLDDAVADYLPEYAQMQVRDGDGTRPCATPITIRHLMTMTSGMTYNLDTPWIRETLEKYGDAATTRQLVAAYAKEPLSFEPGTGYQYSLSHDVIAAVIEIVTGMHYGAYMQKTVLDPLGMTHSGFHVTDEVRANMAAEYMYDMERRAADPMPQTNAFVLTPAYESGGAGLISTVDDYIKFASTLANGGTAENGYELLTRASVDLMRRPWLAPDVEPTFEKWPGGYSYGLGVRTMVNPRKKNARSPIGEFGWDGAAGAYALFDPENDLAIFYAQHCRKCIVAFDEIHPALRDMTYDALGL